ncbi:MAG: sensor domain-containing diguanylate cyclase [Spirochaetales bacterium]|uniref:diguanylate cyclase n=1 Tax=Candidatus Thalassospirochaeta sargassi TaxID=3119039 RepID=A0AAJ1IBW6_9SPIO|nr:sensor domain-containing diguanylate cyclase [Spirochaetales bacterium]
MKKGNNSTVKQVLFRNSILFSVMTILTLGILFSVRLYNQKLSDTKIILEEHNRSLNYFMDNFFRETKNTVSFLSNLHTVISAGNKSADGQAELVDFYKIMNKSNNYIAFLYSGYTDGTMLINGYDLPADYDPRIRPWYTSAIQTSPDISICEPYKDLLTGKWLASTSKTLFNEAGEITGVISMDYELELLNSLLKNKLSPFNTSYSFIFKEDGEIIIHHFNERLKLNLFDTVETLSPDVFNTDENFLEYSYNGKKKLGYYSKIADNGWVIATVVDRIEVLRPIIFRAGVTLLSILIFSLLWGYIQSIILGRRIVDPLLQLREHTEAIATGTSDYTDEQAFPDNEIGHIAEKIMQLASKELIKLSNTDMLTGINNRRNIENIIQKEFDRSQRYGCNLSVMLIDIDFFKNINDTLGHDAGDKALIEISDLFKKNIRQTDTIGRWGGEEFLVICPESNITGTLILAEKIRSLVKEHTFSINKEITVSIGLSERKDKQSIDELLKQADINLYKAKENGRNCIVSS